MKRHIIYNGSDSPEYEEPVGVDEDLAWERVDPGYWGEEG